MNSTVHYCTQSGLRSQFSFSLSHLFSLNARLGKAKRPIFFFLKSNFLNGCIRPTSSIRASRAWGQSIAKVGMNFHITLIKCTSNKNVQLLLSLMSKQVSNQTGLLNMFNVLRCIVVAYNALFLQSSFEAPLFLQKKLWFHQRNPKHQQYIFTWFSFLKLDM